MYATVASQISGHIVDSCWDYSNKNVLRLGQPETLHFLTRRAYHLDAYQVAWFPLHACAPLEDSWWKRRHSQANVRLNQLIYSFRSSKICHRNNDDLKTWPRILFIVQLAGTCIFSKVFKYWGGSRMVTWLEDIQTVSHLQCESWRWICTLCLPTSSNVHLCQSWKKWISQPRGGGIANGPTAAAAATNVLPTNHKNGLTFHRLWS